MNNVLSKLIFIALFIPSLVISAPIKNIEILGLDAISRGTVLSYLPVEVGDEYTSKTSKKIISALYKTQFFKDIEVSEDNQTLKITVTENPHIKYVDLLNYSGKVLNEKAVEKVLSGMGLTPGKIFNKKQLDALIKQLEATYINEGYHSVKINKKVEIDNNNRVGVEVDISEGKMARIQSMRIVGNKAQKEKDLLDLFQIGKPDFFIINYFTKKDRYSEVALDAGIEALKSHYLNLGYLDFKVVDIDSDLSQDKQSINITIQIDEGAQHKVGNIKFSGNTLKESPQSLSKLLSIKTGDIFERKKVIDSINAVANVYTNQGYAFAKINALTSEDKTSHIIDLKFEVSPNQKVYINRITIQGNTRTQDEVIRREIGIYEGGLYLDKELKNSINKLKRLGYFSDVKMNVSKVQGFEDKINLNFSVEEAETGTFSIGLSHSNETGASFNIGVEERNFLGTGNTLNAVASNSKAVKKVNLYFSNPYFTADKHSLSYGVFSKKIDGSELEVEDYVINEKGGSIGYGIPITQDTRVKTDLRLSSREVDCYGNFASTYEPSQCSSNNKTEARIGINWSSDTLNDYNFPTEGSNNNLDLKLALPVADFKYYKLNAGYKNYRPLSDKLTFKTNANIGLAAGYGNEELPFFERYYGGGSSSVRGFHFNSLGPKYANDKAKGGELSLLAGASIISPVTFIKDSKNMRISAFVDAGSISEKSSDFDGDDLRASTGLGFTWVTPIGPLGAYIAHPLIKKSKDKTDRFEITIGTSF